MCGRFTLRTPASQIVEQFMLPGMEDLAPRYNIAPTQSIAAVRFTRETPEERELALFRWGLIPFWAKDKKIGNRAINARSESAAEKPMFRAAMRCRRCLIVADGFYEWKKVADGKQPYFIGLQDDGPFAFAGLWETWRGDEGPIESATILTTSANELVGELHDRMPVILTAEDYDAWIDPDIEQPEKVADLLRPFPAGRMRAYPVSKAVNRTTEDSQDLVARHSLP